MTSFSTKGFSLIELIAVILVLSVIAAIATPRFIDLSLAARKANVEALAGDLSSASASNLATYVLSKSYPGSIAKSPVQIDSCDFAEQLLTADLPEGYRTEISASNVGSGTHLKSVRCDVLDESDENIRADFVLYVIDPNNP